MKLALKTENLAQLVFFIRGEKVMLAQDLAELYGVPVRALNQAVKRNIKRFPADFMFQVTKKEFEALKSQIVTSSWGGLRRALPYAFTEQGVAMLSSVLRSKRAVEVNILGGAKYMKPKVIRLAKTVAVVLCGLGLFTTLIALATRAGAGSAGTGKNG